MSRLTEIERAEAEQTARRLYGELRGVIGLLPEHDRGGSAMARALELDRATCQRLVAATARPDSGVETLVQLPGVMGLRQFIESVEKRCAQLGHGAIEQLAAASAAVDRFEVLIHELGGSQRKLKARLASERAGGPGGFISSTGASNDPVVRESLFRAGAAVTGRWSESSIASLFRAGAAVTGRWSESSIAVSVIRPVPSDPSRTQTVKLRALIGHHARADAVALEIGHTSPTQVLAPSPGHDPNTPHWRTPGILIEPFCSTPLPRMVSHTAGSRIVHVIDPPLPGETNNTDIVIADREPNEDVHPATLDPAVGEVWALMNFPARRLIFDVYLHRDIACRCIPSLELHLWTPQTGAHASSRWSTRFPGGPRLGLLGPGLRGSQTDSYARHAELTAHLFERVGWESEQFIGYRCESIFPVWRGGYCMVFDFSSPAELPAR